MKREFLVSTAIVLCLAARCLQQDQNTNGCQ